MCIVKMEKFQLQHKLDVHKSNCHKMEIKLTGMIRMGLLEEPRYIVNNVCNHFFEMPEGSIRE